MASTVYSSCPLPFTTGCFLYTDSGLTTPVANGIYSDGTNTYTVSGGAGEITSTGLCSSESTTTSTTTTTTTAPPPSCNNVTAINVSGTIILGEPSLDATVFVQSPVSADTLFNITVVSDYGTSSISVTILNGNTSGNNVQSIAPSGITPPVVSSYCISFVDNSTIGCLGFNCIDYSCPCDLPPTTSTTTTTTTLFTNLVFDLTTGAGGYTIGGIDVNSVTPTLTGGTDVPFSTDTHGYNTDQIGTNETLNIFVSAFSLNGCITVTDSASNVFQQNITATGTYSFSGLTIDNITAVNVLCADNVC